MKLYRVAAFLFTSITTGLAAAFIVLLLRPELLNDNEPAAPPPPSVSAPASYADAVAYAAPAVVNVFATKITRSRPNPLFKDPLFRRFFDERAAQPTYRRENSLGSGVIINANGYLLTNNHVIEGASEIRVVLRDGRQFPARIVGTDPETDLAVLQTAGCDLPVATLGNSDKLRVGDVVMAIGNPFGVGQTVTMGIVSATGRDQLGLAPIENFIQTDAAINPGNSGGALINARGEVVGINTAIFSESGGSHGIGFAIPVHIARTVVRQIAEHGRVIRGWIGISAQAVTPAIAKSLGFRHTKGLLVSAVLEGGPADQAGVRPGDLVFSIDGQPIGSAAEALDLIANRAPGETLVLGVERDGQALELRTTAAERPAPKQG